MDTTNDPAPSSDEAISKSLLLENFGIVIDQCFEKIATAASTPISKLPLGRMLADRNNLIGTQKAEIKQLKSDNKKLTDELEKVSIDCNDYRKELAVLLSKQPSMSTQPVPAAPEVKPIRVYGS